MSAPSGKRGRMPPQLTLAEARRRGPRIAVLPDGARVEERLGYLARQRGFVPFRIAFSLAELGRELIREAQRGGSCPEGRARFGLPRSPPAPAAAGRARSFAGPVLRDPEPRRLRARARRSPGSVDRGPARARGAGRARRRRTG